MIHVVMKCDAEQCDESSGDYGWTTVKELRGDMEGNGWAFVGYKHYCPKPACQEIAESHLVRLTQRAYSKGRGSR